MPLGTLVKEHTHANAFICACVCVCVLVCVPEMCVSGGGYCVNSLTAYEPPIVRYAYQSWHEWTVQRHDTICP